MQFHGEEDEEAGGEDYRGKDRGNDRYNDRENGGCDDSIEIRDNLI